ncbi:hypothetical protein BAWEI_54460 [Bacillus mycoides]|uniref:Uncharacterized protein n=1 Tax=Bacillus mycoides TaxID=1405 RepID=A0AAP8GXW4_BACMY|nr:hypothetical protein BAWEI_54460 [Bacillus mycoides]PJN70478.1 hypothetical protein BACWE_26580 [Bacillus mycoides]
MIILDKLNIVVEDLLKEIDTDLEGVKTYIKTIEGLLEQQENKVRETATILLPVMRKIKSNMFYFISQDEKWRTRKGPILKYNGSENSLYIFSVEKEGPIIWNLDTEKEIVISYDKLLKEVEFNTVMESLLSVVSYTENLKEKYQGIIDNLETELVKY